MPCRPCSPSSMPWPSYGGGGAFIRLSSWARAGAGGGDFEAFARTSVTRPPRLRLIKGLTGLAQPEEQTLEASYWYRDVRESGQLARSMQTLAEMSCTVLVEMAGAQALRAAI